jgi:hypothetical protein
MDREVLTTTIHEASEKAAEEFFDESSQEDVLALMKAAAPYFDPQPKRRGKTKKTKPLKKLVGRRKKAAR